MRFIEKVQMFALVRGFITHQFLNNFHCFFNREALPRLDHFRLSKRAMKRPSMGELYGDPHVIGVSKIKCRLRHNEIESFDITNLKASASITSANSLASWHKLTREIAELRKTSENQINATLTRQQKICFIWIFSVSIAANRTRHDVSRKCW